MNSLFGVLKASGGAHDFYQAMVIRIKGVVGRRVGGQVGVLVVYLRFYLSVSMTSGNAGVGQIW